jgi:hypothetical protein
VAPALIRKAVMEDHHNRMDAEMMKEGETKDVMAYLVTIVSHPYVRGTSW